VKGLYARAYTGELKGVTGVDDPYEPPTSPDIVLTTTDCTADECAVRIERLLEARGILALPTDAVVVADGDYL
jgi:adenylylsulfate kinase-like enzyme